MPCPVMIIVPQLSQKMYLYLNFTLVQYRHNISKSYLFSSRFAVLILLWLRMGAARDAALPWTARWCRAPGSGRACRVSSTLPVTSRAEALFLPPRPPLSPPPPPPAAGTLMERASRSVLAFFLTTLPLVVVLLRPARPVPLV